jgi:hypothetical protein
MCIVGFCHASDELAVSFNTHDVLLLCADSGGRISLERDPSAKCTFVMLITMLSSGPSAYRHALDSAVARLRDVTLRVNP